MKPQIDKVIVPLLLRKFVKVSMCVTEIPYDRIMFSRLQKHRNYMGNFYKVAFFIDIKVGSMLYIISPEELS